MFSLSEATHPMATETQRAYWRTYYATHRAAYFQQRLDRRQHLSTDPIYATRQHWLQALLTWHGLTRQELARLLHRSVRTINAWFCASTSAEWMPLSAQHVALIQAVVPEGALLPEATLTQLGWSPLRRAAYQAVCGTPLPPLTGATLRTWRQQHHLSRAQAAHHAEVSEATWGGWERGRAIPITHQHVLAWLMQKTC